MLMKFCEEEGSKEFYASILAANQTAVELPDDDDTNLEPDF